MFSSLKEEMGAATSKYTYKVTYNVYDNMVEENNIISVTIYERIVDDSAKKNTMDKIKTYNIDAATKEQISQSNDIALTLFGKEYKTVIDETAILFDTICISAGKIGYQVELNPEDLARLVNAEFVDITM
jgi:hypothetical protein